MSKTEAAFFQSSPTDEMNRVQTNNLTCEKVIQMLLSLQVPAHEVIKATNLLIEEQLPTLVANRKRKGPVRMDRDQSKVAED